MPFSASIALALQRPLDFFYFFEPAGPGQLESALDDADFKHEDTFLEADCWSFAAPALPSRRQQMIDLVLSSNRPETFVLRGEAATYPMLRCPALTCFTSSGQCAFSPLAARCRTGGTLFDSARSARTPLGGQLPPPPLTDHKAPASAGAFRLIPRVRDAD